MHLFFLKKKIGLKHFQFLLQTAITWALGSPLLVSGTDTCHMLSTAPCCGYTGERETLGPFSREKHVKLSATLDNAKDLGIHEISNRRFGKIYSNRYSLQDHGELSQWRNYGLACCLCLHITITCGSSHLQMVISVNRNRARRSVHQNMFSFRVPLGIFFINILKLNRKERFKTHYIQDFFNCGSGIIVFRKKDILALKRKHDMLLSNKLLYVFVFLRNLQG